MTILKIDNIVKKFNGIYAVNDVSMEFDNKKIYALIGPNGAGKTTIFNLINGFNKPDNGFIYLNKKNITKLSPWRISQLGVGRLFQDIHIFNKMTVKDNILTAFNNQSGENILSAIMERRKIKEEEQKFNEMSMKLLEIVGLKHKANEIADNLSYGQQKLLSIGRLLANDAKIILFDEPTTGVDPSMRSILLNMIQMLHEQGKAIVVIEHNMSVVVEIADFVYFMLEGRIVAHGQPKDVLNTSEVKKAYIGLEDQLVEIRQNQCTL